MICVFESTSNVEAFVPPNFTKVEPPKPVPVIVTLVPAPPPLGVNELTEAANEKNCDPVEYVPPGVVTSMTPVVPLLATAVILMSELTVKLCTGVPPIVTDDACVKPDPVSVIVVPAGPAVGEKLVIIGSPMKKPVSPFGVPMPVGPSYPAAARQMVVGHEPFTPDVTS